MTNHLARLPVELFITICELVHEAGEGPYLARLSRAFVPVGRRVAFRKVEVEKHAHLEQLCAVVEASPFIGTCIVDLELVMPVEENGAVAPSRVDLLSFFRRLVNAKNVALEQFPMAVDVVLEDASGQPPVLPNLVELTIKGPQDGPASLFNPSNYLNLDQYAHLCRLELFSTNPEPSSRTISPPPAQALVPIDELRLYGMLSGDEAARALLSSFQSIKSLRLCQMSAVDAPSDLSPLLDAVRAPAVVERLMLVQQHRGHAVPPESLERFVAVEVVNIGFRAWSPALIPSFASLRRLEVLGLLGCADLSFADLQAILADKDLVSHLNEIQVDLGPGDQPAVDEFIPIKGLFTLLGMALAGGVVLYGDIMEPVNDAVDRFLAAHRQKQDAPQEDAGARAGAAAGAAPEEADASGTGSSEGQSDARTMDPLRSRQLAAPSVPSYTGLSPTSSRGPSLDGAASFGSNPFRDPSLNAASRDASLDLSSRDPSFDLSFASIHSGSPSVSPPLSAVNSRAQQAQSQGRPGLATRPSEVSRQLADAFKEDLPRVSEEASPSPPVSRASSTNKDSKSGLWSQFRTGSGWFAPLVEADQPMTREERAAAEKERIEKLKEGRASNSSRRPGLMKRMSSGVEMGFARSRSGSQSTIRKG